MVGWQGINQIGLYGWFPRFADKSLNILFRDLHLSAHNPLQIAEQNVPRIAQGQPHNPAQTAIRGTTFSANCRQFSTSPANRGTKCSAICPSSAHNTYKSWNNISAICHTLHQRQAHKLYGKFQCNTPQLVDSAHNNTITKHTLSLPQYIHTVTTHPAGYQ